MFLSKFARPFRDETKKNSILHHLLSWCCQLCRQQIIRLHQQVGAFHIATFYPVHIIYLSSNTKIPFVLLIFRRATCRLHTLADADALLALTLLPVFVLLASIPLVAIALPASMSLTASASRAQVVSSCEVDHRRFQVIIISNNLKT